MAKMSEKKDPPKSSVCEHFEPQAWRKTVCKNCFQAPEKHTSAGGGTPNDSKNVPQGKEKTQVRNAGTNENDPSADGSKPMTSSQEKTQSSSKSAASSIKDKYEQLERDKFKPKQPPKVAPKSKGPGGLSVKTDKPERLSGVSSAPVTPSTPEGMERSIIPPPTFPKQPRILNIKVSDQDSGEDVKSGKVPVNKLVKSKFGSLDNVSDTEEKSKVEYFQKSRFGSMENISIQPKKKEPIPIPIQKSKFGGSMENVSVNDRRHSSPHQHSNAADLLNKLDNFSLEIRSGATSNLGSTVIHQQEGGKVDIIQIPIKRSSAPGTPTTDTHKSLTNKESLQNELNEKKLSKGNDMFNKQNLDKANDLKSPSDNESRTKFTKSPSPLADRFKKLDVKSPDKVVKLDVKSPNSEKDMKSDFKSKFDKTDTNQSKVSNDIQNGNANEKVDLRAGLKKKSTPVDNNKTDKVEPMSLFPTLKSTKKDSPNDKDNEKKSTSIESNSQDSSKGLNGGKTETNSITDKLSKSQLDTKVDKSNKDNNKSAVVDLKDSKHKDSSVSKTKDDDVVVNKNKFELPKLKSSKNDSDINGDKLSNTANKNDTNSKEQTNSLGRNKTSVIDGQKSDKNKDSNKPDSKDSSNAKLEDKRNISDKDSTTRKKPEEPKPKEDDKKPSWMKTLKKDDKKSEEPAKLSKPELKTTDSKPKFGKKEDEPNELLAKFAKKDDSKPKFGKLDQKQDSKLGKKDEAPSELLSKFAKKDETKPKFGKLEPKQDSKFGKKEEPNELLSKFAKKDDPKPKFGKLEQKQDTASKIGKREEDKKEKNELLSRFAKKDEPKSKPDDKKTDPKTKFGKQDEKKADDKKTELLSRFAKKDDNKADSKPDIKPEEKNTGRKGSLGNKDDDKSELLSKFAKKTDVNEPKSKFGKKDDNKLDAKSKFGEHKNETPAPFALKTGVGLNKKDKPEENKHGLKSVKDRKAVGVKEKQDNKTTDSKDNKTKTEPTKPAWKLKLEEKAAEKNEQNNKSKLDEKKDDKKSKFESHDLTSTKAVKDKATPTEKTPEKADLKDAKGDDSKKLDKSYVDESPKTDVKDSDIDSHSNDLCTNEKPVSESSEIDKITKNTTPDVSLISENDFDISADGEVSLGDDTDACAVCSSDDSSPMHVDTQVFTSSRQNSVGVIGQEELESLAAASRIGLSDLNHSRSHGEIESDKELQNGDISTHIQTTDIDAVDIPDKIETQTDTKSADELERLRLELNLMMERCSNLEKENEQLRLGLEEKDYEVRDVKRGKRDVEAAIQSLQSKVQLMEEKCTNLESDNDELSGKLKHKDQNAAKPHTSTTSNKDTDHDTSDKLTANEKYVADVLEENETLKQEINELKLEMDEMYDSFRDQEAEEFRELQRELEITAKNCRILQFKLRKMERHGNQLEQDKNHYEEKLRQLQNTFQDRDAVSHIHALEDELRMAKDVSVRLHDELDLMEDKRGKVEEENRHLTELLEQADRKQFRLEMEVDKLRDKIVCLKQEMRQKENPDGDKKLNCSEFLALHRDVI